jgi:hypothetical protein
MLRGLKKIGLALAGVTVMSALGFGSAQARADAVPLTVTPAVYQATAQPPVQLVRYGYRRGYGYGYRRGYYRPYYRPYMGVGIGVSPFGYGGFYGGYGYPYRW